METRKTLVAFFSYNGENESARADAAKREELVKRVGLLKDN